MGATYSGRWVESNEDVTLLNFFIFLLILKFTL